LEPVIIDSRSPRVERKCSKEHEGTILRLVQDPKSTPLQRTSVVRSDRRHDENGAKHAARESAGEAQPFLL